MATGLFLAGWLHRYSSSPVQVLRWTTPTNTSWLTCQTNPSATHGSTQTGYLAISSSVSSFPHSWLALFWETFLSFTMCVSPGCQWARHYHYLHYSSRRLDTTLHYTTYFWDKSGRCVTHDSSHFPIFNFIHDIMPFWFVDLVACSATMKNFTYDAYLYYAGHYSYNGDQKGQPLFMEAASDPRGRCASWEQPATHAVDVHNMSYLIQYFWEVSDSTEFS